MPCRIFQHHGLVHHGELEMGGRVVNGNASVFGQRHDNERNERKPKRNAQAGMSLHEFGDHRELR